MYGFIITAYAYIYPTLFFVLCTTYNYMDYHVKYVSPSGHSEILNATHILETKVIYMY